jgi:hypothetical protein
MRMLHKCVLLHTAFALMNLAAIWITLATNSLLLGSGVAFVWFAVFVLLRKTFMRCPHCGTDAETHPDGFYRGRVGTHCRHCGREY